MNNKTKFGLAQALYEGFKLLGFKSHSLSECSARYLATVDSRYEVIAIIELCNLIVVDEFTLNKESNIALQGPLISIRPSTLTDLPSYSSIAHANSMPMLSRALSDFDVLSEVKLQKDFFPNEVEYWIKMLSGTTNPQTELEKRTMALLEDGDNLIAKLCYISITRHIVHTFREYGSLGTDALEELVVDLVKDHFDPKYDNFDLSTLLDQIAEEFA